MIRFSSIALLILAFVSACQNKDNSLSTFFALKKLPEITFENTLTYTNELNPYTYRNFYNGGGVAIGDINNDGLLDVYVAGNMVSNALYLNQGNWKFKDITEKAGVGTLGSWSTGVSFVDINGDGFLDIYVCKAGIPGGERRHNELFINNGNETFTEQSEKYNLNVEALSVQAAFFDFDKDGDLDCYLLSNSIRSVGGFDLKAGLRNIPSADGNKFFVNEEGYFVDRTNEVGIYSSKIGFGLGITISDFNNDGWDDIFVSNDFFERDYYYLNNGDGTFSEELETYFSSISMGSMGADAGDLNNDLNIDLVVTEMLPSSIDRKRTKALYESWDKQQVAVNEGYYYQFPRNALQKNDGKNGFLELSRFSNVSASEWSWASLIFDADNDGFKDLFIGNGIYKDLLDRDYLSFMANDENVRNTLGKEDKDISRMIDIMPSNPVSNQMYKNNGDFKFTDVTDSWGLSQPTFTNGSVYADLDNDGDLDLLLNNVNIPFMIFENQTDTLAKRSVKVELKSNTHNTNAIGSKVVVYVDTLSMVSENQISRSFESGITAPLHFGVGNRTKIDSIQIEWNNGMVEVFKDIKTNQLVSFIQPKATKNEISLKVKKKAQKVTECKPLVPFEFWHKENLYVDFNRERLIPEMLSNEGPALVTEDINHDGIKDVFVGGAKFQSSSLFISSANGYIQSDESFLKASKSEDVVALFIDIDNDSDLDLYVGSGGRAFSKNDFALKDRIYLNNGKGEFSEMSEALPKNFNFQTSSVSKGDFNNDGWMDLFVGERMKKGVYGLSGNGYLLLNDKGKSFKLVQQDTFKNLGMITSVAFANINNDEWIDLVTVGDWMNIEVWINEKGNFQNKTKQYNLENTTGFWKTLKVVDIDQDGDDDLIIGNAGKNSFFKKGTTLYVNDYDKNGSVEQLMCEKIEGKYYPVVDKDELLAQLPYLKKKLLKYADYQSASMSDIFSEEQLKKSIKKEIDIVSTLVLLNNEGTFQSINLPSEVQYAPVYAIEVDANKNKIFLGGNQYKVKPQFGRQDASKGWVLNGILENEKYKIRQINSLGVKGEIRNFAHLNYNDNSVLIIGINNEKLFFKTLCTDTFSSAIE